MAAFSISVWLIPTPAKINRVIKWIMIKNKKPQIHISKAAFLVEIYTSAAVLIKNERAQTVKRHRKTNHLTVLCKCPPLLLIF